MAPAHRAWRFVTLDVTGTLLRPRESLGLVYAAHWQRVAQKTLSADQLARVERHVNAHFRATFHGLSRTRPHFGCAEHAATTAPATAYEWWHVLIKNVMPRELLLQLSLAAQRELTQGLYAGFASGDAWRLYDDTRPTLDALRASGCRLAVISNFDERLHGVLSDLGLAPYFDVVTTSFEMGCSKPDLAIYRHTFEELVKAAGQGMHAFAMEDVVHIGDHMQKDYRGARAAGAQARLLDRHGKVAKDRQQAIAKGVEIPREHVLESLLGLLPDSRE